MCCCVLLDVSNVVMHANGIWLIRLVISHAAKVMNFDVKFFAICDILLTVNQNYNQLQLQLK
jgi:hypothetical protein